MSLAHRPPFGLRAVEAGDAAFNLLGVAAGTIGAATAYLVIEAIGRLFAPRR